MHMKLDSIGQLYMYIEGAETAGSRLKSRTIPIVLLSGREVTDTIYTSLVWCHIGFEPSVPGSAVIALPNCPTHLG